MSWGFMGQKSSAQLRRVALIIACQRVMLCDFPKGRAPDVDSIIIRPLI